MILPDTIAVQIIDSQGNPNPIEHVLFGLKVFTDEDTWDNYSPSKTNASGLATIAKNDILEHTELKWSTGLHSGSATKIELYVWEGKDTDALIQVTKHLLDLYSNESFLRQDLKRHGIAEEQMAEALQATENKQAGHHKQ